MRDFSGPENLIEVRLSDAERRCLGGFHGVKITPGTHWTDNLNAVKTELRGVREITANIYILLILID